MDLTLLREFALELADAADAISMRHFGGPVPAVAKPDGSPVTEADQAIERLLRERIAAAFPDHAVMGEEGGGLLHPARPTWVIDPIDGTKNYMRGVPVFATLIGLAVGGEVIVGVASSPAMGERWDASRGGGARRNGEPVGVSGVERLEDAHLLLGGLDWWRGEPGMWDLLGTLVDRAWRTRGFGDFWMHLLVAGGMAEVALDRDLRPWDIAALDCILTEAGGRCTGWDGSHALTSGSLLSTNGLLHDELRALLCP
ncbi:MAG: inositol monophosphatase family protein [Egibacteraceae bacterium]